MRYVFSVAMKKLRNNLRRYIPISLQIAVGIGILAVAMNMQLTAAEQLRDAESQVAGSLVKIGGGSETSSGDPISYADYMSLRDEVKAVGASELIYYKFRRPALYKDGQMITVNLYIVDDLFYKYIAGTQDCEPGTAYAGSEILPLLGGGGFQAGEYSPDYFDEANQTLFGVDLRTLRELTGAKNAVPPMEYNMLTSFDTGDDTWAAFAHAVFIPFSAAPQAADSVDLLSTLYVSVDAANPAATDAYCAEITRYLAPLHPEFNYSYTNFMQIIVAPLNYMRQTANLMQAVAVVVLVMVFLGLAGLLMLIVNRRKRDLAISVICGARKRTVFAELMVEVMGIVCFGAGAGMGIGAYATPMQVMSGRAAENHGAVFAVCATITLVIGACVCLIALATVRNNSPIDTVKSI